MDIVDILVQTRKEKKLTQKPIYETMGVNQATFSRYDKKKRPMSLPQLEVYADLVGYELRLLKK